MPESPSKLQRDAARSVVNRYLKVQPGENVIVESWDHVRPMASAMVDEVRRAGGKVLLVHNDEDSWWRAIERKQTKLLGESSAPEWAALKAADVYVNFWGPSQSDRIQKLPDDPGNEAFAWNWPWYAVARRTGLRGVRMTTGFATEDRARTWGLDLPEWEEQILKATLVDPEKMAKSGAQLSKSLSQGKRVQITHPNGTDLSLTLTGAVPRVQDGRPRSWEKKAPRASMLTNIPAGFVDVALDSRAAGGQFHANRRTNIWWNWHSGAELGFSDGRLTAYSFKDGEEEFARQYHDGSAGKDLISALTFGLNPVVKDVPNLEKWEGGCVSLQIGGNVGLGGKNRSNFFTWFCLAGADVAIDGTPVVRGGNLIL